MISLKDVLRILSYLQMIHLCFPSFITASKDLEMIHNWAFQWKMNFNSDPTRQTEEVIFRRKTKELSDRPLASNNANVTQSIDQKHLGIILDS